MTVYWPRRAVVAPKLDRARASIVTIDSEADANAYGAQGVGILTWLDPVVRTPGATAREAMANLAEAEAAERIYICPPCKAGQHPHLEFLEDRESFLRLIEIEVVQKGRRPIELMRSQTDCKNVTPDGRDQCFCQKGRP